MKVLVTTALTLSVLVLVFVLLIVFLIAENSKAYKHQRCAIFAAAAQEPTLLAATFPGFPIDLVYTWVDGKDAAWRQAVIETRRAMTKKKAEDAHNAERDPNPIQYDELYYSIRLALKCMTFIRKIIIVTQRPQKPWWLDLPAFKSANIVVVHHDEFFQSGVVQPTFNSSVIITQLPFIKDLSEHYILSDDDMFPFKKTSRAQFFTDTGTPVIDLKPAGWVQDMTNTTPWFIALRRTAAMAKTLGVNDFKVPPHQMIPLLKTPEQQLYQRFKKEVLAMHPLRSKSDFIIQYLLIGTIPTAAHEPEDNFLGMMYHSGQQFVRDLSRHRMYFSVCINNGFDDESAKILESHIASIKN